MLHMVAGVGVDAHNARTNSFTGKAASMGTPFGLLPSRMYITCGEKKCVDASVAPHVFLTHKSACCSLGP